MWLLHQHRQAYDLAGTEFSDFQGRRPDRAWQRALQVGDNFALREAKRLFALSGIVAERLRRYNGLNATPLYCPPPPRLGGYRNEGPGDYVFTASRLDPYKRVNLLVEAMAPGLLNW